MSPSENTLIFRSQYYTTALTVYCLQPANTRGLHQGRHWAAGGRILVAVCRLGDTCTDRTRSGHNESLQ